MRAVWSRCSFFLDRQRRWKLMALSRTVVGKATVIERGSSFSLSSRVEIGSNTNIGANCDFHTTELAGDPLSCCLSIGDNVWLSRGLVLVSHAGIKIGNDVLIGEYTSIRDATHGYRDPHSLIRDQAPVFGSLVIEDDVWIGRGCLIQGKPGGVVIGGGAVVAANSVVGHSIPTMEVWGGVPARFIRKREKRGPHNPSLDDALG